MRKCLYFYYSDKYQTMFNVIMANASILFLAG